MIAHDSPNINDEGVFIAKDGKDTWMQTYYGRRVSVMNPTADQIHLDDIVISLSKQCRFNGHCSKLYTVLEHSYRGAVIAKNMFGKNIAKEFLIHDATEAYLGDLIRPVKRTIPEFEKREQRFWKAISEKFNLPYIHSKEVHYIDNVMVTWEKRDLLPHAEEWPNLPDITSLMLPTLVPMKESIVISRFNNLYKELFNGF